MGYVIQLRFSNIDYMLPEILEAQNTFDIIHDTYIKSIREDIDSRIIESIKQQIKENEIIYL